MTPTPSRLRALLDCFADDGVAIRDSDAETVERAHAELPSLLAQAERVEALEMAMRSAIAEAKVIYCRDVISQTTAESVRNIIAALDAALGGGR